MLVYSRLHRTFVCLSLATVLLFDARSIYGGNLPQKKLPVPDAAVLAKATALVKEVYGDEYAGAKTPAQKTSLAGRLLVKAGEADNDSAECFVLLRLSRVIAMQANDGNTALRAIDRMDETFQVNVAEWKRDALIAVAASAHSAEEHRSLAEKCLTILESAMAKDDFAGAKQVGEMALDESRKSRDKELARRATERCTACEECAKAFDHVQAALAILDRVPDDPDANQTVGSYQCLLKGNWDEGIPLLALGKNPEQKAAAIMELVRVTASEDQEKLADAWWTVAEQSQGAAKKRAQLRALLWYKKSLPGLAGLIKIKVEKRIDEIVPDDPGPGIKPSGGGTYIVQGRLKLVERDMVVLQTPGDNKIDKISYERLSDGDQKEVSDWEFAQISRIWSRGIAASGRRSGSLNEEQSKAIELGKAFDGAFIRLEFRVAGVSSSDRVKTGLRLGLSGERGAAKAIVLPLSNDNLLQLPSQSRLAVEGRMIFKYAFCTTCGGTGKPKCPNCIKGSISYMTVKPVVFPNGDKINQTVKAWKACPMCQGTGHSIDENARCNAHERKDCELFGTRKLPFGAFFALTKSDGARYVCMSLDDPRIKIYSDKDVITIRRLEGKIDAQTKLREE